MSEQKIANTFEKMRDTIDQYTKVVRQDGALWKSIEELGGDPAWLNDIKTALDAVYTAIEEADMGARMHLDMQDESADLSEEPNEGNEFSGALAQAKQTGKKEFKVGEKNYKVQEAPQGQELRFNSGPIKGASTGMNLSGPIKGASTGMNLSGPIKGASTGMNLSGPIKGASTGMNQSYKSSNPMASTGAARRFRDPKFEGSFSDDDSDNNMFMGAVGKPYEDEDNPVKDAIMHRLSVSYGMEDLLKKYGLDRVEAAIDDVASFHDDAEELGSSDISIMVKQVMDNLESTNESLGYLKKLAGI